MRGGVKFTFIDKHNFIGGQASHVRDSIIQFLFLSRVVRTVFRDFFLSVWINFLNLSVEYSDLVLFNLSTEFRRSYRLLSEWRVLFSSSSDKDNQK